MNTQHETEPEPEIDMKTMKTFVASMFVATNVAGAFVWNELAMKKAFVALFRENATIRPFGMSMLKNGTYLTLFAWLRDDCVDVMDGRRNMVRLNDTCLHFANKHKAPLLSQEVIVTIRALGPEFYRRTQLGA